VVTLNAPQRQDPPLLGDSADAFGALVEPFRRELLVHCYRMLGSIDDAEDAVQDALAHAWQGRATFQRSVSLRAWLYRIATNACLDAIQRRRRSHGPDDRPGVGPVPDDVLAGTAPGPEARYDARESISLAFLTALQVLPPRQRAVLILRDVLSWRAAEVAELLDLSVVAVNSALQRARSTLARRYTPPKPPCHLRAVVERYVRAWESADIAGLVSLLRDDAVLNMPPLPSVAGAAAIGAFLAGSTFLEGDRRRLAPTTANGSPALLAFDADERPVALLVLAVDGDRISQIDAFADARVLARFAKTP
jgi:RNA polymerase sigma-70 factor (ECF subfamily)